MDICCRNPTVDPYSEAYRTFRNSGYTRWHSDHIRPKLECTRPGDGRQELRNPGLDSQSCP